MLRICHREAGSAAAAAAEIHAVYNVQEHRHMLTRHELAINSAPIEQVIAAKWGHYGSTHVSATKLRFAAAGTGIAAYILQPLCIWSELLVIKEVVV